MHLYSASPLPPTPPPVQFPSPSLKISTIESNRQEIVNSEKAYYKRLARVSPLPFFGQVIVLNSYLDFHTHTPLLHMAT